jgi:hypothetical protein
MMFCFSILIPLYDADTRLLYLCGKGVSKIYLREFVDTSDVIGCGTCLVFIIL